MWEPCGQPMPVAALGSMVDEWSDSRKYIMIPPRPLSLMYWHVNASDWGRSILQKFGPVVDPRSCQ